MILNKGLRSVLVALIKNDVITASWGVSNIGINTDSLSFDVIGLKYKGSIIIEAVNESEYIIHIGERIVTLYSANDLVAFLDKIIERTPNYLLDLNQWFIKG